LPVEKTGSEGVVDRKLESSPSLTVGAQKKETLESNQRKSIYYYGATDQKLQTKEVLSTCCQHHEAYLRATKHQATGCKHAQKGYALTVG